MDVPSWCKCGHCHKRKSHKEAICCVDYHLCLAGTCITDVERERLQKVALDDDVLVVAVRNTGFNGLGRPGNHELRKAAYRQFELLHFGNRGPSERICLPSCVVELIHRKYPAPDGQYMGFIEWAQAE